MSQCKLQNDVTCAARCFTEVTLEIPSVIVQDRLEVVGHGWHTYGINRLNCDDSEKWARNNHNSVFFSGGQCRWGPSIYRE